MKKASARLPAETTSFVGRQRDIADVRRLIAGNRLVTLTGAGTNEASAAVARAALGDEAYQAAYRAGRNLSPREAVGYAVEPGPLPTPAPDEPARPSPLTRRERQVAQLVAEGLPNKQIAARLLISQRTAESHVENILAKLGFTSRTQVATWVAGGMG
jgi:DNA-binding NarL/FixJ family response regulator